MPTPRSAGFSRRKNKYIKRKKQSQYSKYLAITNKKKPQISPRNLQSFVMFAKANILKSITYVRMTQEQPHSSKGCKPDQTELYKVLQNFAKHDCKKRAFLQTPVSSAKMLYKFWKFK